MRDFGFAASAWTRAAVGVCFGVAAVILVWVIERPRAPAHAVVREPITLGAVRSRPLTIESTYPVQQWSISVLGREQPATHSDVYGWTGMVEASPDSEILITAAAQLGDSGISSEAVQHHSLRIVWDDTPPRLVWGGGDITATVVVKGSRQAAATKQQATP